MTGQGRNSTAPVSRLTRHRLLRYWVAFAALIASSVVAIALAQAPIAVANPSPSVCQGKVDPYSLSEAQRAECGDHTYPLTKVVDVPGGGKEYIYNIGQAQVAFMVPPPSFEPGKADAAELKHYGMPPTPTTGSAQYERWQELLPEKKEILAMKHYATAGNTVLAEVEEISSTECHFFVDDIGGESHSFVYKGIENGYDGSSADYIVERPEYAGGKGLYFPLMNFGEVPFEVFTNNKTLASYGHESIRMEDKHTGHLLAQPGGLSHEDAFTDYHYNCE